MNRLYFQDLRISDSSFGNYFFYKTYLILTILAKESSGTWMIGLDFFLFTTPKLMNSWTIEHKWTFTWNSKNNLSCFIFC